MADKVLMKGNEAIAEAAIIAGGRALFWVSDNSRRQRLPLIWLKRCRRRGTFLQAGKRNRRDKYGLRSRFRGSPRYDFLFKPRDIA